MTEKSRFSLGWFFVALVLTLLVYYLFESLLLFLGAVTIGAIAFENSWVDNGRILLLPVAGYIVFRALWSMIRETPSAKS